MIRRPTIQYLSVFLLWLGFTAAPIYSQAGKIESVQFQQLDIRLAGGKVDVKNSDWGYLLLAFRGSPDVMYLNLSVGGTWVIRNIPVLSLNGDGVTQAMSFAFPLGVKPGQRVQTVSYGLSLTQETSSAPPTETNKIPVTKDKIDLTCSSDDTPMPLAPAVPLEGGPIATAVSLEVGMVQRKQIKSFDYRDFPNQEAGPMECGPVAVSNSLIWLNKTHGLGLKLEDLNIKHMLGWTRKKGVGKEWFKLKDAYMKAKGMPIETTTVSIDQIEDKMNKEGCDIELSVAWHVAAIVRVIKLKDGRYWIMIRHDIRQGVKGGTTDQVIIYNPITNLIEGGGSWLHGRPVFNFVAECPKKGSQ